MNETWVVFGGIVTALVTAFGTVVVAIISRKAEQFKASAANEVTIADAWQRYSDKLDERVNELEAKLDAMGSRISEAEKREQQLLHDLRKVYEWIETGQRHAPPPRPNYLKG